MNNTTFTEIDCTMSHKIRQNKFQMNEIMYLVFSLPWINVGMVKNLPTNAGDMGSDPWSRKFLHAVWKLSLLAATAEAYMP